MAIVNYSKWFNPLSRKKPMNLKSLELLLLSLLLWLLGSLQLFINIMQLTFYIISITVKICSQWPNISLIEKLMNLICRELLLLPLSAWLLGFLQLFNQFHPVYLLYHFYCNCKLLRMTWYIIYWKVDKFRMSDITFDFAVACYRCLSLCLCLCLGSWLDPLCLLCLWLCLIYPLIF